MSAISAGSTYDFSSEDSLQLQLNYLLFGNINGDVFAGVNDGRYLDSSDALMTGMFTNDAMAPNGFQ